MERVPADLSKIPYEREKWYNTSDGNEGKQRGAIES